LKNPRPHFAHQIDMLEPWRHPARARIARLLPERAAGGAHVAHDFSIVIWKDRAKAVFLRWMSPHIASIHRNAARRSLSVQHLPPPAEQARLCAPGV
jgi:hypothetical protein